VKEVVAVSDGDDAESTVGAQREPCATEGCDGEMYLAVPEASEWCCDDCRTAYVRVQGEGWVGGVSV